MTFKYRNNKENCLQAYCCQAVNINNITYDSLIFVFETAKSFFNEVKQETILQVKKIKNLIIMLDVEE